MATEETYLGDGLYGRYDGFEIVLRAPRENGDHVIYMEPEVFEALKRMVKSHDENRNERAYERSLEGSYRGGEAAGALAESQARIQRELKR